VEDLYVLLRNRISGGGEWFNFFKKWPLNQAPPAYDSTDRSGR
jgi:hypothetical protein